jgi:hypothetical protein
LLFDNLTEMLLRGGIAPRHVRRYLAELREHLEDLTAQQRQADYGEEDAVIRARARLGTDGELAAAMLEQKQFRSWTARAPWAVFVLLPPFAAIAIGILFIGTLVLIGKHYGFLDMHAALPPQWFQLLATGVVGFSNLVINPLAATLFVGFAARQRLAMIWPLAATALLLIVFIYGEVSFLPYHKGHLALGFAPIFKASAWKAMIEHWPLESVQYLLTCLPLLWLYRKRRLA